ncbi:MAG: NCS2 family permease [Selenomonadaceae bacterium]
MNLKEWFKFSERNTSFSTETLAGLTTFVTMAYIIIVNPAILSKTGMDFNGVFIATIVASMIGTLIMGIFANYPIAIAPGMGMNAYFAFAVVIGMGIAWQQALGTVFIASAIFVVLSFTKFRQALINSIPTSLKQGIGAGIGLFVTFIGLQSSKLVISSPATIVTLGNLSDPTTFLSIIGLLISLVLMVNNVKGALFIGMILTSIIAFFQGLIVVPASLFSLPTGLEHTFMQMDVQGALDGGLYAIIFTFLIVTLFDTTGTMLGIGSQAGLIKADGEFPNVRGALLADAFGSTFGALLGTSPTSSYVESGAGVAAGGRTGFSSVIVALLFGLMLFCAPIAQMLASIPAVTAPALIIVGFLMMNGLKLIDWNDMEEAVPAFLTLFMMPMSYSITTGVGVGFIVYPLLKIFRGKARQVHPLMYLFMVLFIIQLGFMGH